MSQVRKIAHNTIWQFAGKIASVGLGLVAVAIMTRVLGLEKFGWYSTAIGFLQFIGILTDFGFTVVTANLLSEPAFDKNKLLNNLFSWRLLTALLTQGLIPLTIFFFPYPAEVKWAAVIMSLSFIGVSLNQVFVAYYRTKLETRVQALGEITGRVVLVVGLALAAWGNWGFLPMMAVVTLGSIAYTSYLWLKCQPVKFEFEKEISRAIFKKIWPTALAVIFNCFYLQGDRFILPLYVSQSDVGLYGAAYRVLDIIMQSASMLIGIMMPLITYAWSRDLKEEFTKHAQRAFDLMAFFILPMAIGAMALANPLMRFVAGKEFGPSGPILALLAVAALGINFGMVFGHIVLSVNRQKQALWIYFSDAVLSVIGYFIFIPKFGVWGAAWVTIFSEFYAGLGLLLLAGYFSKFWPGLRAFGKIILASVIMGLTVKFFQPLNILLSVALGCLVYGGLVLALRVISRDTWQEVLRRDKQLPI